MSVVKKKLENHLLAFLRKHAVPGRRPGLLVAISGGLDSTALLHLAVATRSRFGCPLVAGHFNHKVRPDADAEEERLRAICERLGIPFRSAHRQLADSEGSALNEAALRGLRYRALRGLAREADCGWILLGHQQEDQAETVLLNLVRGTGVAGLRGMPSRRGRFLRPLLDVPRSELRRYLEEIGESWVDDPTNLELQRARNVVRLRLIPLIEQELRPRATASIARAARHLGKVHDLLEEQTRLCLARCRQAAPPGEVRLDARRLATYHEGLIEQALRQAVGAVRGSTSDIPASLWQGIVDLQARGGGGRFLIPGDTSVEVTGRTVRISRIRRIRDEDPDPSPVHLPWKGRVTFPAGGGVRTRRLRARREVPLLRIQGLSRMQVFDVDALRPPLRTRPLREGDRVAIGGGGTKKVVDLMAERGIPRSLRGGQPVVEDTSGILWVPGIRRADRAMVGAGTDRIWVVRWIGKLPVDAALMGGETRR